MDESRVVRACILSSLTFGLLGLVGCDEDMINVTTAADNQPPLIVSQGPEFPTDPVEGFGPTVWVLAGDPNGLDDIAAVFLSIETIRVNGIILRPDAADGGCAGPLYEPDNTISTASLFSLPVEIAGPRDLQMTQQEGAVYAINPFGVPAFAAAFAVFGSPSGCASGPPSWIEWLELLPPAVPSATSVFVTFVDVEYINVSVTIYDASGESATTTFPDLRKIFITSEEEATAP